MLLASCWRAACMASHDCGATEWRGLAGLWKQCKKQSASAWRFNCSRSLAKAAFMAWVVSINMLECHVTSNLPYQEQYFQKVFLFSCSVASSEQVNHGETCQKHHKLWVFNILFQSWNWIRLFSVDRRNELFMRTPLLWSSRPYHSPRVPAMENSKLSSVLDKRSVSNEVLSSAASINCCCRATSAWQKKKQNWSKIYVNYLLGIFIMILHEYCTILLQQHNQHQEK